MSLKELELQKREIEVLKICQHPNIIRLIDVFENPDYIYIGKFNIINNNITCSVGALFWWRFVSILGQKRFQNIRG